MSSSTSGINNSKAAYNIVDSNDDYSKRTINSTTNWC